MKYYHLSEDERLLIDHFFNIEKLSISQIAKKLNTNKATISRELKRNVSEKEFYLAQKKHSINTKIDLSENMLFIC